MPYKTCDKCKKGNGVRAKSCQFCGNQFSVSIQTLKKRKEKKEKISVFDWRTLSPGDEIEVKGGPYYLNDKNVKVRIGHKGLFRVSLISKDGIECFEIGRGKKRRSGFAFIYMGPKLFLEDSKIYKRSHKILRVRKKDV